MKQFELFKIINAAWNVNAGDNGVEIQADFGLDCFGEPCVNVYVYSPKKAKYMSEREIIESFATYEPNVTIESAVLRITKYDKSGGKHDSET